jgi:hypothetical protein
MSNITLSHGYDIQTNKIVTSATSFNDNELVPKSYVASAIKEGDFKNSVRVATTGNLVATRVSNVLTADANGSINTAGIDGVTTLAINNRVLVKDQSTGADNGIYDITDLGSAGTPFVLTRSSDCDTSAEVTSGLTVHSSEGTSNGDSDFVLTTNDTITINSTALVFAKKPSVSNTAKKAVGTFTGDGSTTQFTLTHNLDLAVVSGSIRVAIIQVFDSNNDAVGVAVLNIGQNNALIEMTPAPANLADYYWILVG